MVDAIKRRRIAADFIVRADVPGSQRVLLVSALVAAQGFAADIAIERTVGNTDTFVVQIARVAVEIDGGVILDRAVITRLL